ncbi:AAA family ATPase [Micromonospora chersina]|uniref:AAA family ATPase n=1 Tax=Micromonospora chersina TaxID=47854 RepID=UPI003681B21E
MRADEAGPPEQPEVVLMCGVAGAGKTTYAKDLETEGYVRLSVDEEIWHRFGRYGVDYEPDQYEEHTEVARRALRERLLSLVAEGRNVVIDSSFWQRSRRQAYKELIEQAGAAGALSTSRPTRRCYGSVSRRGLSASMPTPLSRSPTSCWTATSRSSSRRAGRGRKS